MKVRNDEYLNFDFSLARMLPYGKLISTYSFLTAIETVSRAAATNVPLAIESATCKQNIL